MGSASGSDATLAAIRSCSEAASNVMKCLKTKSVGILPCHLAGDEERGEALKLCCIRM